MNLRKGFRIAVVGATGAVGRQLLSILWERRFPVSELIPFASARSENKEIPFGDQTYRCRVLRPGCFSGVDLAFFDASDAISKEWVPQAVDAGAWVVDNSATFRMNDDVLLLVPEVNGHLLANGGPTKKIISGPNCSTAQLVVALRPLRDRWGLKRVVASTYQSASGAGTEAMTELSSQTAGYLEGRSTPSKIFAHQIAFNCIPQIGGFQDEGYTSEESKIIEESRKILEMPNLRITATAVRVPTFSCHGESVNVECDRPFSLEQVRAALEATPGVVVQDTPAQKIYPMGLPGDGSPVEGGTGRDSVYVGRIRRDSSVENGLNLWVVSDNLRKGAALNAVQIGEILLQKFR